MANQKSLAPFEPWVFLAKVGVGILEPGQFLGEGCMNCQPAHEKGAEQ
jgi:hypothetical protein